MGGRDEDLPFRIELWDDADRHVEEAVKRRPGQLITLRQKARVIKKSR